MVFSKREERVMFAWRLGDKPRLPSDQVNVEANFAAEKGSYRSAAIMSPIETRLSTRRKL